MKNAKRITSVLIATALTMAMFVGCSSKTAETSTTMAAAGNSKSYDSTAMKTLYSSVLKALVTDKTITQIQSDKVLAVLGAARPTDGRKRGGKGQADGQKPSGEAPTGNQKPSGNAHANGTRPKNNRLSQLVTSKVITQAQADTINKNVQAAMKDMQGTKSN